MRVRPGGLAVVLAAVLALSGCAALPARSAGDDDEDGPLAVLELSGAAARYLAIAEPANLTLDRAFDALEDNDGDLAAAQANFRLAAATEHAFDLDLLAIDFPPAIKATARALVDVNEARFMLTVEAAQSSTFEQVEGFEQDISVANDVVEVQVGRIRQQLGLPPPDTS